MATFAISAVTRKAQATANGSTTEFSFSFSVNTEADVAVFVGTTLKTISTHYTVSITSSTGAGSITFTSGNTPTNGQIVTIMSKTALARSSVYTSGGTINATSLETDFDTNMMLFQQQDERLDRTLIAPVDDATSIDMTLPNKDARKGTVLGFNATSGNPEAGPSITAVQSLANVTTAINLLGTNDAVGDMNTLAAISGNITTAAGISTNIPTVAGISANVTTVAGISSNVTTVAGITSDISTVAADASDIGVVASFSTEVNAVGDNIASVNIAAANLTSINAFSETYSVGSSDPTTSLNSGDLFYNTTTNQMKVYTGSAWVNAALTGGSFLPLSGGTMTGVLSGLQQSLHLPQSVTGATPALNVGNNNFFDNGTLTATTSPTFTNVPTKARWQYSFNSGSGGVGYHIPDMSVVGQQRSFRPIATVARPTGLGSGNLIHQIRFSANGDKIFFMDTTNDRIREYALTSNWDITTIATSETTNYYYGSIESNGQDFSFRPDGLRMYITGIMGDGIDQFTLTSAFDLTSISGSIFKSLGISDPYTHYITDDGTKLFVMQSSEYVAKFNFGSGSEWDVSSLSSYVADESGTLGDGTEGVDAYAQAGGFTITPDGLTLIAQGRSDDRITHSALFSPYVMGSVPNRVREETSTSSLLRDTSIYAFGFSHDGKYMWLSGHTEKTIALFDTSSPCQVTLPSSVAEGSPTLIKPNARTTMEFVTSNGGTNVNLIKVDVV